MSRTLWRWSSITLLMLVTLLLITMLQPLVSVAAAVRPAILIDDDTFLNAPGFDSAAIQAFLGSQPGVLKAYQTTLDGAPADAADVISVASLGLPYEVNPQVLLALLEASASLVSDPQPGTTELDRPFGLAAEGEPAFEADLFAMSLLLRDSFAAFEPGVAPQITLANGNRYQRPPLPNAGTYALEVALGRIARDAKQFTQLIGTETGSFQNIFAGFFGPPVPQPGAPPPEGRLTQTLAQFLYQPFAGGFRAGSFFDHNTRPGAFMRFDGATNYGYDGHGGTDYPMPHGSTVLAAADGVVVDVAINRYERGVGSTWCIGFPYTPVTGMAIRHSVNGVTYTTWYWHLSAGAIGTNPRTGQPFQLNDTILRGEMVGLSGNTGCSTGPHLHFGVQQSGRATDPYGWCGNGTDPYPYPSANLWAGEMSNPSPCPGTAATPPALVAGSLGYAHNVAFSSGVEQIAGGPLHSGDTLRLRAQANNPAGVDQEIVLDVELSLGAARIARQVRQMIPANSTVDLSALAAEEFRLAELRPGNFGTTDLTITARAGGSAETLSATVKPRPVVCLHGYTGSASGCDTYKSLLEGLGVETFAIDSMNMGQRFLPFLPTATIPQNAYALRDYVDSVRRQTGATDVILLAHSMGGLVSRAYIDALMPTAPRAIHTLVMLGTPNEGSNLAWLTVQQRAYLPASIELLPPYVRYFNTLIQNRSGVPFYMVDGESRPDISFLLGGPDDCVVATASTRAIALDRLATINGGLCYQGETLHERLAHDQGIFDSYIKPLITDIDYLSTAVSATPAALPQGPALTVDTNALLDLATLIAGPGAPARHAFYLDNVADVSIAIMGDPGATVELRLPDNSTITLSPLGATDPFLPTFIHTMPAPTAGRYLLTIRSTTPESQFAVMVNGRLLDNQIHLSAPAALSTDRPTLELSATLTSELKLTSTRLTAEITSPSGVRRSVALAPATGETYAGVVALSEPGVYSALIRAEGRAGGKRFVRTHPLVIERTADEANPVSVGYAVAGNDHTRDRTDVLMVVDPASGQAAVLGPLGTTNVDALALAPGGRAYVVEKGVLGSLDLRTGQATLAQQPIGIAQGASGAVPVGNISGLSFDPTTGRLTALQRRSRNTGAVLVQIDPATGLLVRDAFGTGQDYRAVAGLPRRSTAQDLARDPLTGQLYSVINRSGQDVLLVLIDPLSGAVTPVGPTLAPNLQGLSIAADGTIYATSGSNTRDDQLFVLDRATGQPTLVGTLSAGRDYEAFAITATE